MAYTLNGEAVDIKGPEDIGGVTFVPLGNVVEMLGGDITWDGASKTAAITLGSKTASVTEDQDDVTIDGDTITLPSRPSMGGGTLWVPLSLFEGLGCKVSDDSGNISISSA